MPSCRVSLLALSVVLALTTTALATQVSSSLVPVVENEQEALPSTQLALSELDSSLHNPDDDKKKDQKKQEKADLKVQRAVEPKGVRDMTIKAIKCGNKISALKGDDVLRLVFLLNTQLIMETRTIGQAVKQKTPYLAAAAGALIVPAWPAVTYFAATGQLAKTQENMVHKEDMHQAFKTTKTMLRVLYQLTHVLMANTYPSWNDAADSAVPQKQEQAEALKAYVGILEDIESVYRLLKETGGKQVEKMKAEQITEADVRGLAEVPRKLNGIRDKLQIILKNMDGIKLLPVDHSNPNSAKRVNCKTLSMVLRNANDRLTEHDVQNEFRTSIAVTTAKLVSSVLTTAAAVGGSCSPAGPAGGALAGAVVGLVTSMGTSMIETVNKYSDNIKHFRREVRRTMITFLGAQAQSAASYERKAAREAAVRSAYRKHKNAVATAKKNKKKVPSQRDLRVRIKDALLAAADAAEPDCKDGLVEIYHNILSMLHSDKDNELTQIIKTCTSETQEEFNSKWRNKGNPSTFERLLPTYRVIAEAAGMDPDALSAVEGPTFGEVITEVLTEKLPEFAEVLNKYQDNAETANNQQSILDAINAKGTL